MPETPSRRRFWLLIAGLFALAIVARLVLIAQMGNRYYFADTAEYEMAAQRMLSGEGPGRWFPRAPLYPAMMAFSISIFGEKNYTGMRLVQLLIALGLIGLTAAAARAVGRHAHAVFATAMAAIAPTLVFTTSMLYPTVLYSTVLMGLTLVAILLDRRPTLTRGVWLGVLITLGWLTEQVIAAPLLAILLWLLFGLRRHGPRLAVALVVALGVAALTTLPVVRWYRVTYGRAPVFMEKAQTTLWIIRNEPKFAGQRAVRDTTPKFQPLTSGQFVAREWRLLREQPAAYLGDYAKEFVHFFQPMPDRIVTENTYTSGGSRAVAAVYFLPVLALAVVGLLSGGALLRHRLLLAMVPLATAALYALFFTQMRYRVPTEPQLLVLAALGIDRLMPWLARWIEGGGAGRETRAQGLARAAPGGSRP